MKWNHKIKHFKLSIKTKLFVVIIVVLSANILVVLGFGNTFLNTFYIANKKDELKNLSQTVNAAYQLTQTDQFQIALQTCAENNVNVLIYDQLEQKFLFSPSTYRGDVRPRIDANLWMQQTVYDKVFERLEYTDVLIYESDNQIFDSIFLYTKLNEHTYLFMETPKAYIKTLADTAMRFFLYLSLGTLAVAIIAIYVVASKIAKPIAKIDRTAQKIASMDFSESCDIHTGDEIEALANSVNIMSVKLKEHIQMLQHDLEREEQTNKMRQEFVANVSHDFKTPLSLISAYSEALKDDPDPNHIDETCDIILEQSNTMNYLVNQLLTLSQLESGMMQYDMSIFSINELISTVVHNCRILLDKNEIPFELKLPQEYIVKGDYNRIIQVVTNLFENAIKYVDQRKVLNIWLELKDNNHIRVCIFNSHSPMPQEELDQVFNLFYRADKSRNSSAKSYGIGLAIVKTIIEAHHDSFGAYNHKDGVVFWFELENVVMEDDDEDEIEEDES